MDFGWAINALKAGHKVTRKGWNGKGMFLWLMPATNVKADWCKEPVLKKLAEDNGGEIPCLGTIRMYTHDSTGRKAVLTGWLASQSDMLEEDWQEYVEPKTEVDRIVCAVSDIAQFADDLAEGASEQLGIKVGKRDILAAIVDAIIQSVETGTPVKDLLQDAYEKALKDAESNHV